jgi:hypothetical protein
MNHLKRTLTKLVTRRKERTIAVGARCLLERLEDRAMLSASYGSMPHGHGGTDFGPHGGHVSHVDHSTAFVSQSYSSGGYDTPMIRESRTSSPMYGDFQAQPLMQPAFGPGPEMYSYEPHWSEPMWNPFVSSPPPPMMSTISLRPAPAYDSASLFQPTNSSLGSSTAKSQPVLFVVEHWEITIVDKSQPPPPGPPLNLNASGSTNSIFDHVFAIEKSMDRGTSQNQSSYDKPYDKLGQFAGSLFASGSGVTNIPSVPQILSRETGSIAALSAVARDLAFQEYAPRLFSATVTNSSDRTNLSALGTDAAPSEVLDGFIRPTDPSIVDSTANSTDAVARERDAVDAVLESLRDVDKVLPATASTDVNFQSDLQTETASDELPVNEVDGGMVLLQSTGDANDSGFDLTPVYADQLERFNVPAKMETSIGMFQAIDVAADDTPISDTTQKTEPTIELNRDIKLDDQLPAKREKSSHKAAALVGATTLTGALVWLNRSSGKSIHLEPTAQKRRAARS